MVTLRITARYFSRTLTHASKSPHSTHPIPGAHTDRSGGRHAPPLRILFRHVTEIGTEPRAEGEWRGARVGCAWGRDSHNAPPRALNSLGRYRSRWMGARLLLSAYIDNPPKGSVP